MEIKVDDKRAELQTLESEMRELQFKQAALLQRIEPLRRAAGTEVPIIPALGEDEAAQVHEARKMCSQLLLMLFDLEHAENSCGWRVIPDNDPDGRQFEITIQLAAGITYAERCGLMEQELLTLRTEKLRRGSETADDETVMICGHGSRFLSGASDFEGDAKPKSMHCSECERIAELDALARKSAPVGWVQGQQ